MLADRRRDQEKLPLVRWKRLLDLNLPSFFKKDDYSALLVSILRQFQVEHMQNPDHKSEMSDVYLFLSELAEGKYPAALSGSSALVLLSLLEGLSELIESDPRAAENSRLVLELFDKNSRIFQKIFLSKDVEAPDINEFLQYFDSISKDRLKQDLNKAKQQLANEIKRTPNQSEALSKEENPLHYYAMLPKIKRVQRCWNPLEVPVHDLKQQHESLVQNQSTDAESDSV